MRHITTLMLVLLAAGALAGCVGEPAETIHVTIATEKTELMEAEILPGIYAPLPGEDERRAMHARPAFFEVLGFRVTGEHGQRVLVDIVSNRLPDIVVRAPGNRTVLDVRAHDTHLLGFSLDSLNKVGEASFEIVASAAADGVIAHRVVAFSGPALEVIGPASFSCQLNNEYTMTVKMKNTGDLAALIDSAKIAGYSMHARYAEQVHVMPGQTIEVVFDQDGYGSVPVCESQPAFEVYFHGARTLSGVASSG